MGIALLSLWTIQLIAGLYVHTPPAVLGLEYKNLLRKYHRFLGMFIYAVGLATCAMGFQVCLSHEWIVTYQVYPLMLSLSGHAIERPGRKYTSVNDDDDDEQFNDEQLNDEQYEHDGILSELGIGSIRKFRCPSADYIRLCHIQCPNQVISTILVKVL